MSKLMKMLLFSVFAFLLGCCSQIEKVELNEMQGDIVVLKVGIDGIKENPGGPSRTKGGSEDSLIAISDLEPVDD